MKISLLFLNPVKQKFNIYLIIINIITLCYFNKIKSSRDNTINIKKNDFLTKRFAIIRRLECNSCGLFSFYIVHLGCINKYLSNGYIPIIDMQSFENVYNKFNKSINPWELFFYQPYNYTLLEVKKFAKNVSYLICTEKFYRPDDINIYYDKYSMLFWHNFAKKYIPIKDEIIYEIEILIPKLFNNSKNILGVKIRGTDYLSQKPKGHPIPPKVERVISDVKEMDKIYKYDYIFFASEDEIIKSKFKSEFRNKLKLLNPNVFVEYNYNMKSPITLNKKIIGNLEYIKNYLLNILILSKCLDIVTSKGSGAAGIFVLTNGFRHIKIYDLGKYP